MSPNARFSRRATAALALAAVAMLALGASVSAEDEKVVSKSETAEKQASGPRVFETPEAAAQFIIEAAETNDDEALASIAGADRKVHIPAGSDPAVAKDRADFAKSAKEYLKIKDNPDGTKTLIVGNNLWPLPMPLKKVDGGWIVDVEAGAEEMSARRIGRNELRAISVAQEYARAQIEYASEDRDGDEVREYAQKVKSSEGKHDGLYWPDADGESESPFGPFVTTIREVLDGRKMGDVLGGYEWRILTGQGPSAPGGRHTYIINGNMIAGFGLIGTPAVYGKTGIMTFVVSHHGKVLEKDLGESGLAYAKSCRGYNPDDTWTEVDE